MYANVPNANAKSVTATTAATTSVRAIVAIAPNAVAVKM